MIGWRFHTRPRPKKLGSAQDPLAAAGGRPSGYAATFTTTEGKGAQQAKQQRDFALFSLPNQKGKRGGGANKLALSIT